MKISAALLEDAPSVTELWKACVLTRPWNDPVQDFTFALKGENSTVLAGKENSLLVASAMIGHDGHRGAIYYLAVAPGRQGRGLGRMMHKACVDWLKAQGVWKINLMVRDDNAAARAFYEKLGYVRNDVVSFGLKL